MTVESRLDQYFLLYGCDERTSIQQVDVAAHHGGLAATQLGGAESSLSTDCAVRYIDQKSRELSRKRTGPWFLRHRGSTLGGRYWIQYDSWSCQFLCLGTVLWCRVTLVWILGFGYGVSSVLKRLKPSGQGGNWKEGDSKYRDRIVIVGVDEVLEAEEMVGSRRRQLSSTVIWSSRKASVSLHAQQQGIRGRFDPRLDV